MRLDALLEVPSHSGIAFSFNLVSPTGVENRARFYDEDET